MAKFVISCKKCGAGAEYDPDYFNGIIGIQFDQGTLNIMDRMIMFCNKCGNKEEVGIAWPINLHNPEPGKE